MIYETVRQAFQNIWSNKFRTLLTMLGIIIGVMAVIVIVGLGNGMTQSIKDSFADMGTNILSVQIMGRGSRNVSVDAVYDIVESHPDLFTSVSPTGTVSGTVKVGTDSYSNTTVKGVSEVYFDMLGYTIDEGRLLNYVDLENNKKSASWVPTSTASPMAATPWAKPSRSALPVTPSSACWKPRSPTRKIRKAATMI